MSLVGSSFLTRFTNGNKILVLRNGSPPNNVNPFTYDNDKSDMILSSTSFVNSLPLLKFHIDELKQFRQWKGQPETNNEPLTHNPSETDGNFQSAYLSLDKSDVHSFGFGLL